MDPTDPLADTAAPRYAIESDEEEDEPNPLRTSVAVPVKAPEIKIIGLDESAHGRPLIIASGRAGAVWARGANLGEQQGGVYVDKIQVGLLFTPSSLTPSSSSSPAPIILISSPFSPLPLSLQHPYASTILSTLSPSRVALLDTYSAPAYASEASSHLHDAPVRFISISAGADEDGDGEGDEGWKKRLDAHPFAPPNLLQSTTAAFLLALQVSSLSTPSLSPSTANSPPTALLLPSLQYPTPPPKALLPSSSSSSSSSSFFSASSPEYEDHADSWPAQLMSSISRSLLELVGVAGANAEWRVSAQKGEGERVPPVAARRSEVGEGGMYL